MVENYHNLEASTQDKQFIEMIPRWEVAGSILL